MSPKKEKVILTEEEHRFFLKILKCQPKMIKVQLQLDGEKDYSQDLDVLVDLLKEKNLVDLFEKFKKKIPEILFKNQDENILYMNLANAMLEASKDDK